MLAGKLTTCLTIGPDFGGIMGHLHSTIPYLDLKDPISRPGCWACKKLSSDDPLLTYHHPRVCHAPPASLGLVGGERLPPC
eukprot:COSAG05_NODE_19_length_34900_cov_72.237464_2_plen_81_part_00